MRNLATLAIAIILSLGTASSALAACSDPAGAGVDWSGCVLPLSSNLSGLNLSGANLEKANLSGLNLSGANLREANLSGASLEKANLSGANLSGANLSGADLRRANLSRANLHGADLEEAYLSEADLSGAIWVDGRKCSERSPGECR